MKKIPKELKQQLIDSGIEEMEIDCHYDPQFKIQKWDVWGKKSDGYKGMRVARTEEICPIWKDKLPYKSVTVVCKKEDVNEVIYWLSYVHGGPYSKMKDLKNGNIAIRSRYQA